MFLPDVERLTFTVVVGDGRQHRSAVLGVALSMACRIAVEMGEAWSIDGALTPARLSKRIGKSQPWVRDRMAVTVLPARWRVALGKGTLSLGGAVAAAVADLGPDHLDAVCALMVERTWRDPKQTVDDYRRDLRRGAAYDTAVAKHQRAGMVVFFEGNPMPATAMRLHDLGLDGDAQAAHVSEPCHGVAVTRGWVTSLMWRRCAPNRAVTAPNAVPCRRRRSWRRTRTCGRVATTATRSARPGSLASRSVPRCSLAGGAGHRRRS